MQISEGSLENYNNYIVKKIYKDAVAHFPSDDLSLRVCDFGAGVGSLSEILRRHYGIRPICVELDPKQRVILKSRDFASYAQIEDYGKKFCYVFTSNVLEHIEDDNETLMRISQALEPKGRIAIYVPALPFLFSDLDKSVGHYRRYKRSELIAKVEKAGFKVDSCKYKDSVGVLASVVLKVFGFKPESGFGSKTSLLIYDKVFFPISRFLDVLLFSRLVGKNLFLFAEKT